MKKYFLITLMSIMLFSCVEKKKYTPIKYGGQIQGTYFLVTYFDDQDRDLRSEIDSLLADFDETASIYAPTSLISRINRNEVDTVNEMFKDIFNLGMEVSKETDGAFDMTVMPLVNFWGFGNEVSEIDEMKVDSLLQIVGYEKVWLEQNRIVKADPRIKLDFNGIAQGYSIDILADFLKSKGIKNMLVDIGGEAMALGEKPLIGQWKVGIERPATNKDDGREVMAIVSLKDKAISTSGSYRKYHEYKGERYSHSIDPKTGYPVQKNILSVTIIADNTVRADIYCTACMVLGVEKGKELLSKHDDLEGYFIYLEESDNAAVSTYFTPGFRKYLDVRN